MSPPATVMLRANSATTIRIPAMIKVIYKNNKHCRPVTVTRQAAWTSQISRETKVFLTISTKYSSTIINTLCISSIKNIEIDIDILYWWMAIIKGTVWIDDISTWACVINVSDPGVDIDSLEWFCCEIALFNVGRQSWITDAFTCCWVSDYLIVVEIINSLQNK